MKWTRWYPYALAFVAGLNYQSASDWIDDVPRRLLGCWSALCPWSYWWGSAIWLPFGLTLTWIAAVSFFLGEGAEG